MLSSINHTVCATFVPYRPVSDLDEGPCTPSHSDVAVLPVETSCDCHVAKCCTLLLVCLLKLETKPKVSQQGVISFPFFSYPSSFHRCRLSYFQGLNLRAADRPVIPLQTERQR